MRNIRDTLFFKYSINTIHKIDLQNTKTQQKKSHSHELDDKYL